MRGNIPGAFPPGNATAPRCPSRGAGVVSKLAMAKERTRPTRIVGALLFAGACALLGVSYLHKLGLVDLEAVSPPPAERSLVRFSRFSANRDHNDEGERLTVSVRLRTDLGKDVDCFAFVVARNDHVSPHLWSIWPPQLPGPAITSGGHFHGATPSAGHRIVLNDRWQRLTATIPRVDPEQPYDTVVVYLVSPDGRILLERPFRV